MESNIASEAAPATSEQVQHVTGMLEAQVGPMVGKYLETHEGGVRFVDNGTEAVNDMRDAVRAIIEKYGRANQYTNEEVHSSFVYPPEYHGPRPIAEQVRTLAKALKLNGGSALEYAKALPALPEGAEGWFAVPQVDISRVLACITDARKFYNYRSNEMDRFRVHARTKAAIETLVVAQGNSDILIVAAQLGLRHRGRSVRRARECFVRSEFGLDHVMGTAIALTHPERFVRWEQLHMDLPGGEFDDSESGVRFGRAPFLGWRGGRLRFDTGVVSGPGDRCGSASGFLPQ